jgi:hypothetical protein
MEIFSVLLIVLAVVVLVKLFSAGLYILSIPIKLVFLLLSIIFTVVLIIPFGIFSGLVSLLLIPFAIIIPFLPVILIVLGVLLLAKRSN